MKHTPMPLTAIAAVGILIVLQPDVFGTGIGAPTRVLLIAMTFGSIMASSSTNRVSASSRLKATYLFCLATFFLGYCFLEPIFTVQLPKGQRVLIGGPADIITDWRQIPVDSVNTANQDGDKVTQAELNADFKKAILANPDAYKNLAMHRVMHSIALKYGEPPAPWIWSSGALQLRRLILNVLAAISGSLILFVQPVCMRPISKSP